MRRRVQRRIQPILAKYQKRIARAITSGTATEAMLMQLFNELRAALAPEIAGIMMGRSLELMDNEIGVGFDIAVISEEAQRWAESYAGNLVQGIDRTTRKLVRQSVSTWTSTPGMTRGDLEALLAPAFGEARASSIAVTEVTRAYSEATNEHQRALEAEGVTMRRVWDTLRDELVCPICGPLNGLPEEDWKVAFPSGPPAHPNCRCALTLSAHDADYHRADAEARATAREKILREKAREDGRLGSEAVTETKPQDVTQATMFDAIENEIDIRPHVETYDILDNDAFDEFARSRGETISIENIAGFNVDGAITIRQGYEDSALHEFIHSAGFMPDEIHVGVNEGMTQAFTEDLAKRLGITARSGYTGEVKWVNEYVIPLTGKSRQEVFTGYAASKHKQKYLADLIWKEHGHRFSDPDDWGRGVRERFMRDAVSSTSYDTYLSFLVDELGVTTKAIPPVQLEKVKEFVLDGHHVRIIYITDRQESDNTTLVRG